MFSLFARFHRHQDLENAIIELSKEISTIRIENAKIRAKYAVDTREKIKENTKRTINQLPQDVRDVIAELGEGEVESVLDKDGHAVYSRKLAGME